MCRLPEGGWKVVRIANSGKRGNQIDGVKRVDGVGGDSTDSKDDRRCAKAMKTNQTEEMAAF
jgi:hypothetical protein